MATQMVLKNVILSFPHLVTPWSGRPDIELGYSCNVILPQDFPQWNELQACVQEAITAKFGATQPANLKMPWLSKILQPKQIKDGKYAGCYYLSPSDKRSKPAVVDQNVQPIPDLQVKEKLFAGCIVNVYVGFYGYGTAGDGGVGVGLNSVQLVNDQVEPLQEGGGISASEVFQAVPGAPAPLAPVPGVAPPVAAPTVPAGPPVTGNPWE